MDFTGTTLLPVLLPFTGENEKSVVIMDNAVIDHMQPVIEVINSIGALVRFYPTIHQTLIPLNSCLLRLKNF